MSLQGEELINRFLEEYKKIKSTSSDALRLAKIKNAISLAKEGLNARKWLLSIEEMEAIRNENVN